MLELRPNCELCDKDSESNNGGGNEPVRIESQKSKVVSYLFARVVSNVVERLSPRNEIRTAYPTGIPFPFLVKGLCSQVPSSLCALAKLDGIEG